MKRILILTACALLLLPFNEAKALVILMQLKEVQDNYGDVPVSESERTKLTDFLVQNYEVLHDKPVTNEAAEELYKAIGKYNTIGELIDGLVLEL